MTIGQFTDKDLSVAIESGSLAGISGIVVTFAQDNVKVDIEDVDVVDDEHLVVHLLQQHTGKFRDDKPVSMQMNYFNMFGKRKKTNIVEIGVETNLLRRIIEYV